LRIRPATAADIAAMMELERAAPEASHWSHTQYAAAFSASAPRRLTLVLEHELRAEGLLMARDVDGEWEIENIVIGLAVRRQGLGTQLLRTFLGLARTHGAKTIWLDVRASNSAARALYEKCGFIHRGGRLNYYREPEENAVQYRLIFL
jgi:[ribosomal protein S18]-alanine N-acetyltransferase